MMDSASLGSPEQFCSMPLPKLKKQVSLPHLNSWRMYRQFLDHPFESNNLLDLINAVGWIYSPGCSTPYLSLWSRLSSFRTEQLNKLVFDERKLVQLETLRGCTMLVPRNQAAVALRIRPRTYTELTKQARLPVTDAEMDKLKTKLIQELEEGSKTTTQLQAAIPRILIKDFGPELKRIGFINSLSLALESFERRRTNHQDSNAASPGFDRILIRPRFPSPPRSRSLCNA